MYSSILHFYIYVNLLNFKKYIIKIYTDNNYLIKKL